ncbi:Crp/Fnr family transcriptional regulator [Paenibacillus hodogayensis]|uniref:Crp/Fnr family transcriptional regulator n=1 Tax=Paenibacillus hodogayensis TaxID=279208 RepID=A0ABV5VSH5_9BACL
MTQTIPMLHRLADTFPCFRVLSEEDWAVAQPHIRTFPAGTTLFSNEDAARYAVFLLDGTVRISTATEAGREALSNRLAAGDICAMMVLSGLSERDYPGTITAETEATALFVTKSAFLRWIGLYAPVRNAVFGNILDGLIRMGSLLSGKTSMPVDLRLAEALLRQTSESQPVLRITHRHLAVELGSAREVVSRILARMQKHGWIETGRGWIAVRRRDALTDFVGDPVTEKEKASW